MYTIATAGHIDHGKSALVQALTGKNPERLPEEQRREMTIELGFASFKLPGGEEVGIIDVPGHERYIKTMIAGVGNGLGSGINMTLGADFAPPNQRGEFLGVWRLLSDTGSLLGPMAVGTIASAATLSGAFYFAAGVGGLGVIVFAVFVQETLQRHPKRNI